jgi:4-amino-4-deoxy-L-arabinose transferase-like glycosyltransferase
MSLLVKDKIFWFLLIFSAIYIIGNIGTGSLTTWDECYYSILAKEMASNDTFYKLTFLNKPFLEKPPLYIWSTALFYKAFGINEFSSRITSSIFGVLTVLLVYLFGMRLSGKKAGLISALVLLGLPHYLHFSKMAMFDVTLTFFIVLMVYAFSLGEDDRRYLFLSGIAFGLGYLTKGFAACLGPFIVFFYAISIKKQRLLISRNFILGIVISSLVILAWYAMQYYTFGIEQIKDYFNFHILTRATQAIEGHTGGINFYQKAIFNKNKPWSVLLFISVLYMLYKVIRCRDKKAVLLLIWVVLSYALYSLVKTKLHWYIMPIYPALALSSGLLLARCIRGNAYKVLLACICLGLLLQIPYSWSFKIDFSPDEKAAAIFLNTLHKDGASIYYFGEYDNNDLFYFDDIAIFMPLNQEPAFRPASKDVHFILKRDYINDLENTYKIKTKEVRSFNELVVLKKR